MGKNAKKSFTIKMSLFYHSSDDDFISVESLEEDECQGEIIPKKEILKNFSMMFPVTLPTQIVSIILGYAWGDYNYCEPDEDDTVPGPTSCIEADNLFPPKCPDRGYSYGVWKLRKLSPYGKGYCKKCFLRIINKKVSVF